MRRLGPLLAILVCLAADARTFAAGLAGAAAAGPVAEAGARPGAETEVDAASGDPAPRERVGPRPARGLAMMAELATTFTPLGEGLLLEERLAGEIGIGGVLFLEAAWSSGILVDGEGFLVFPGNPEFGASLAVATRAGSTLSTGISGSIPGREEPWPLALSLGLLVPRDPALVGLNLGLSAVIPRVGRADVDAGEGRQGIAWGLGLEASFQEALNDNLGLGAAALLGLDFTAGKRVTFRGSRASFGATVSFSGAGWHCSVSAARTSEGEPVAPRVVIGTEWGGN